MCPLCRGTRPPRLSSAAPPAHSSCLAAPGLCAGDPGLPTAPHALGWSRWVMPVPVAVGRRRGPAGPRGETEVLVEAAVRGPAGVVQHESSRGECGRSPGPGGGPERGGEGPGGGRWPCALRKGLPAPLSGLRRPRLREAAPGLPRGPCTLRRRPRLPAREPRRAELRVLSRTRRPRTAPGVAALPPGQRFCQQGLCPCPRHLDDGQASGVPVPRGGRPQH